MSNEWYFVEYEEKTYLHNKVLSPETFLGEEKYDHTHCELCWATLSKYPCDFQNGYYEPISKSWICPNCYNEFAPLFGWTVE